MRDAPRRLKHRHFLRTAADRCAVKQAMRFVQLLPRRYADTRTYNMLVTVCGAAGDVTSALHAADMLRSTGGRPDTIMYTNLIAGAHEHHAWYTVYVMEAMPQCSVCLLLCSRTMRQARCFKRRRLEGAALLQGSLICHVHDSGTHNVSCTDCICRACFRSMAP